MAIPENASRTTSTQQHESAGTSEHEGVGMAAPAFQLDASAADANGLPAGLKYGVERESGFDLSAVRVRRGSSLPAKFGALAIAKGLEVHLAPGQEDKLPHEVWHLVQQWRGIVKPTHTSDGQAVNKDPKLEAEASAMGEKANQKQTQELDRKQLRQPSPIDVVQCMAVQISLAKLEPLEPIAEENQEVQNQVEGELIQDPIQVVDDVNPAEDYLISHVNIVGRPEKAFYNSMGDHTTAFSVHQKGLQLALRGKTIEDGAKHIAKLIKDLDQLPGMDKEVVKRVTFRAEKMEILRKSMDTHQDEAIKAYGLGSSIAILHLQRLVAEYLEYRELVPFSVMNIASVSMALAGKGKGEAGNASLLEAHEAGTQKADQKDLQTAIIKLLDTEGLAILCGEASAFSRQTVLPGVAEDQTPKEIIEMVVKQHLMSIKMSFPNCYLDSGIEDIDAVIGAILKIVAPLVKSRVDYQGGYLRHQRDNHNRLADEYENREDFRLSKIRSDRSVERGNGPTKAHLNKEKTVEHDRRAARNYGGQLQYIQDLQQQDWIKEAKKAEMIWEDPSKKTSTLGFMDSIKEGKELKEREEQNQLEEEVKQTHATELEVGEDGKIMGFNAGGRTPSPFGSQTMGAHTTAWIVHLDEIRQRIRGKTPEMAIYLLNSLSQIYYDKCMEMIDLIDIDKPHEKKLVDSLNVLTGFSNQQKVPTFEQFTFLQSYINALLTFINFIPGATVNKVNTNGHGEAESRKYMLDFEAGKVNDLDKAKKHVKNLLDTSELESEGYSKKAIQKINANHREVIARAYPKYAKALETDSGVPAPKKIRKIL